MSSPFMFVAHGLTLTRNSADLVVMQVSKLVRISPSFSVYPIPMLTIAGSEESR